MLRRLLLPALCAASVCAAQSPEERASRAMESALKSQPSLLAFLREMPKGADLHTHLTGAVYAESLIGWAAADGLCVDSATLSARRGPCGGCDASEKAPAVGCALESQTLFDRIVDSWSMRNWTPAKGSGHDHFFATFDKFLTIYETRIGDALAEVASRAASDRLAYVELMHTADDGTALTAGGRAGWDDDLGKLRGELLDAGLRDAVKGARSRLDRDEARRNQLLGCGTASAQPGCGVLTRYLYQVLRGLPKELVFAQIVLAFELTKTDPRFVGFNLVMPEDWLVPMRDFDLHMRMIEALRPQYPGTRIALHAGELAMGLAPPEGLRSHIRRSVERAGAERIGHGVSVMHEDEPLALLADLAKRNVLVEICLTSNDAILGVSREKHPLPIYLKHGVPVTLATDDQGVARSDMTHEYLRAVQDFGLGYGELKRMARRSLTYSFLPREERERLSRDLETRFAAFEKRF